MTILRLGRLSCLLITIFVTLAGSTLGQSGSIADSSIITLLDGSKSKESKLYSIEIGGDLILGVGEQQKRIRMSSVLRYGSPKSPIRRDEVVLHNGSRFSCIVVSIGPQEVRLQSRVFSTSMIPTKKIRGIIFSQKTNRVHRQRVFDALQGNNQKNSEVLLNNGDVATGELARTNSEEEIRLTIQNLERNIGFDEIEYLRFPSVQKVVDESQYSRIGLDDGTRLNYLKLNISDSKLRFEVDDELSFESEKALRGKSFFDRVEYLRPKSTSFRFLSSSSPLKIREPPEDTFLKTRFNRSVVGGPLLSGGKEFENGIGTHSGSQVIYSVNKDDRLFRTTVALDDSANVFGNVKCRVLILGDDNKWTSAIKSIDVTRTGRPQPIEVNVSGARAIGLVTSTAENGRTGDRVNWLDARIHQ